MAKAVVILIVLIVIIFGGYYIFFKKESPNQETMNQEPIISSLSLTSPAFENMGSIPVKYTCDGQSLIPPLKISGVDKNAKSLVLIMDDPDAPMGTYDHWLKFNLPATLTEIKESTDPGGISGSNTSKSLKYIGPCPPDKEHRYFFKLYSLDVMLDLKEGATKSQIENAMQGNILQQTQLIGLYNRQ